MERQPTLHFSISHTTRPKRRGETHGHDYFFVDDKEFESIRARGGFLEHAEVFGNRYGTGREQVEQLLADGRDVLLEIDWQGAQQVRANLPECVSIFILPPSMDELEARLRGRSTDSEEVIRRRLAEAIGDISHWREFDHVIINDDLDEAVEELLAIVRGQGDVPDRGRIEALFGG
jgi:guanylate kinase